MIYVEDQTYVQPRLCTISPIAQTHVHCVYGCMLYIGSPRILDSFDFYLVYVGPCSMIVFNNIIRLLDAMFPLMDKFTKRGTGGRENSPKEAKTIAHREGRTRSLQISGGSCPP